MFCALLAATLAAPVPKDAGRGFDGITPAQIEAFLGKEKPAGSIDGSNTKDNKLTAGAVLVYRTNGGQYGKLQVVEYGYNLTVRYATYDNRGRVASSADKLVVRGTYLVELDTGRETDGKPGSDAWWEQQDGTVRAWTPMGKAVFGLYPR